MLNPPPPPPVVVVISNALRSAVLQPLLPQMSDSAIAGHMSNLMKQQQPPALPSHLLRVGCPFSARAALLLPLLHKPTMPLPPLLPAAAANHSSPSSLLPSVLHLSAMSKWSQFYGKIKERARDDPIITNVLSAATTYVARKVGNVIEKVLDDRAKAKARASLLLPLLQKPTMPLPRFPAAAAGSSLYNNYYITNFNFNAAAAAATARRQFSTSPSSTEPVPQGSTPPYFPAVNQGGGGVPVVFGSSSEASYGDVMGDMESQMSMNTQKPDEKKISRYELRIRAILALVFFYFFLRSVAAVDIQTLPPTNRKMIVFEPGEEDKGFQKSIAGRETLPSTDHYSCKVRSMLEGILSNMDKVIK